MGVVNLIYIMVKGEDHVSANIIIVTRGATKAETPEGPFASYTKVGKAKMSNSDCLEATGIQGAYKQRKSYGTNSRLRK